MKISEETLENWKGIQASKASIFAVASKEANRLKESSKFKTDKESANFFFTWRSRIYGCLKGEQKFTQFEAHNILNGQKELAKKYFSKIEKYIDAQVD